MDFVFFLAALILSCLSLCAFVCLVVDTAQETHEQERASEFITGVLSGLLACDCWVGMSLAMNKAPFDGWIEINLGILLLMLLDRFIWYFTLWSPLLWPWQSAHQIHQRQVQRHQNLVRVQKEQTAAFERAVVQMQQEILKGSTPEDLKFLKKDTVLVDYEAVKKEALRRIREQA